MGRLHRLLLFDEFWIPRRTVIATAQGLKKLKATQGPLADLKVLNSPNTAVDALWEGHLLRWLKQMALRGSGRCFDEHGICGPQKLVCSADRTRLLSNFDRLFPGASVEVVTATATANQSYADVLLDILSRPGLPDVLSTKWISEQMHTPWRNVSKHVMILEPVPGIRPKSMYIPILRKLGAARRSRPESARGVAGQSFEAALRLSATEANRTNSSPAVPRHSEIGRAHV